MQQTFKITTAVRSGTVNSDSIRTAIRNALIKEGYEFESGGVWVD